MIPPRRSNEPLLIPLNELTPAPPQRLMRYIVFWCEHGDLEVVIDDKKFLLKNGDTITITSGQYFQVQRMDRASGYQLDFSYDYFCKDDFDVELIFQNGLFCHFDDNEIICINRPQRVAELFSEMREELELRRHQFEIFLHSQIKQLLIEINRSKLEAGRPVWKPAALFLKFLELVREKFDHRLPVKFYADQLRCTEHDLNELARQHAGKTALMVIHGLITSEAKRILLYENRTIKEVAAHLGFSDPFYFSAFFKKHTGIAPSAYITGR